MVPVTYMYMYLYRRAIAGAIARLLHVKHIRRTDKKCRRKKQSKLCQRDLRRFMVTLQCAELRLSPPLLCSLHNLYFVAT